ncbi:MAG TPA: trigger factor, partial [Candidatus Fusicatenibacter merdavium]|nr:trigger factor [Candidatus Fusicatenibacter merdavium]
GFEEQLVGVSLEQPVDVKVTFPEDYQAEELKGKEAVFKCVIHKIEKKELPELDDDFAKDVSEFDTLEEYKKEIKDNLEKKKADTAKTEKENAVVDKAIENATMEIPEAMVKTQVNQMIDDFARRIQSQGLTMDQYMQFTGSTMETMQEQMRPQAMKRIQSRLVLEKVAEVENIQISDEKLDEELTKLAEMYKMELDKFKEMIDDYQKDQMKKDLAVQEAVTLMADSAKEVEAKAEEA